MSKCKNRAANNTKIYFDPSSLPLAQGRHLFVWLFASVFAFFYAKIPQVATKIKYYIAFTKKMVYNLY